MSRIESVTVAKELVEARSGKTDLNESSSVLAMRSCWVFRCFPVTLVLNHHAQKQGRIRVVHKSMTWSKWVALKSETTMKAWNLVSFRRKPQTFCFGIYGSWSCQVLVQFFDDWGKGPNGDSPLKEEAVHFSVCLFWEMFIETMRSTCPFFDQ